MADFMSRLGRNKLFRRSSAISVASSSHSEEQLSNQPDRASPVNSQASHFRIKNRLARQSPSHARRHQPPAPTSSQDPQTTRSSPGVTAERSLPPELTVEEPTPDLAGEPSVHKRPLATQTKDHPQAPPTPTSSTAVSPLEINQTSKDANKPIESRSRAQTPTHRASRPLTPPQDYFGPIKMTRTKVWIKRPKASPTTVQINGDDLVDDVRDLVLRKYANSLGRSFDAPDISLKIVPRDTSQKHLERILEPDEVMAKIIQEYYPHGQTVDDALVIDAPHKRTPKLSPRVQTHAAHYYVEDNRPLENGNDYFPPMPLAQNSSHSSSHDPRHSYQQANYHPHSMSIVETGQLPALPSPGARKGHNRPKSIRHNTSSPTLVTTNSQLANGAVHQSPRQSQWTRNDSSPQDGRHSASAQNAPPIPTPPAADVASKVLLSKPSTPPLERIASPRPVKARRGRKASGRESPRPQGEPRSGNRQQGLHLESTVPPINVLIVEDNPINLRLLEAFVKRLKVRWQTAMNGRDAVTKWRTGGFHLVLMDINLPIMSGLEATKEIRRLERVNGIGVFAKIEGEESGLSGPDDEDAGPGGTLETTAVEGVKPDDKLDDLGLFKSPVIIVALTASSLQSDRHEALTAGCNDFLTKPVNFSWFERKVMEWGCMQALIDYDGWHKWKDLTAEGKKDKAKAP